MIGTALVAATALAGTAALITWLRRRFVVIEVDGSSMQPTLYAGDRVLVRRRPLRRIRVGDIVVVTPAGHRQTSRRPGAGRKPSDHTWVIKRAAAVPGDPVPASVAATVPSGTGTPVPGGRLLVLGDNPAHSTDSRHYGYLSGNGVLGIVIRRLQPSNERPAIDAPPPQRDLHGAEGERRGT